MSVLEQKYQAVLAVISDGRSVSEVAQQWGVSRQSVHAWLRRYEDAGLDGLRERSRRPVTCPQGGAFPSHPAGGAIGMEVPGSRFWHRPEGATRESSPVSLPGPPADRSGDDWVCRRAGANGVVAVSWQQVCLGKAAAGHTVDVHVTDQVTDQVLQFWDGPALLKTVARTSRGEVRKKRASVRTEH